jgi:site-specific DNA recombinase
LNRQPKMETDALRRVTVGRLRCAIYTRKSTDEGLDQNFNSLDAQRESAEAFILSQSGEGLSALPERYDDGGFSGGNLDRPALERLLADIRGGAVDCVVVYKVDRLSRSLIDFARIIEVLDKHNVSFVSVTQQFNTTNSLGRLTLNILLSFAQFEREIIAERTRDKVSAARRKGKWTGGRPMLGYDIDPHACRLIVNADEAFKVRAIFKLYLDNKALQPVVKEIHRRGWRTKQWITRSGLAHGGTPFTKGRLFRLLRNPIYIGKIDFENAIYEGEHEAIVESAIWEEVQQILQRNGSNGGVDVRDSYGALLKGLLRCASCLAPMIRTRSTKDSRRNRHYVCTHAQQRGGGCQTRTVTEVVIKAVVIRQIQTLGSDPRIVARGLAMAEEQRLSSLADLTLERQAAQRELTSLRAELTTITRSACTDQPATNGKSDLQYRIDKMECRLVELIQELGILEAIVVDNDDFRAALAAFNPVWESLNSREQARIIVTLIDRIVYNGETCRATVSFRSAGVRNMCRGTARAGAIES